MGKDERKCKVMGKVIEEMIIIFFTIKKKLDLYYIFISKIIIIFNYY